MVFAPCRALASLGLLLVAACGSEVTEVVVILEADPEVAAAATRLGVEVVSQNGDRTQRTVEVGATPAHGWPFRVPIVPIGGDASRRVLFVAEAVDGDGESLGVQRAELSFVEGQKRFVVLRFSASCRQVACGPGTTCRGGRCVGACVRPGADPGAPAEPGPCVREDGGVPDLGPPDAGPPDGGPTDAGMDDAMVPDAGPLPIDCPTPDEVGWVEGFETVEGFERCSSPPCETSPSARAELVTAGSVLAPDGEARCGDRFLRLVRFTSPSEAFFVAPASAPEVPERGSGIYLRAWMWVNAGDDEAVSVLGLVPTDLYRENPPAGVEVEAGPVTTAIVTRGVEAAGSEELTSMLFPLGQWVCAELGVDFETEEIEVAWEGERMRLSFPGAAELYRGAPDVHARAGMFRVPDNGTDGTAWLDEVAVSTEPLRCP